MKTIMLGILAVSLVGCESLREGFSFHTIGTMLDGQVCFKITKTEAQQEALTTVTLLRGRGAADRADSLQQKVDDPYTSGPALCNANREQEGYLHHRSIREGRYE